MRPAKTLFLLSLLLFQAHPSLARLSYTPVITPDGSTLPYEMDRGVKVFRSRAYPGTSPLVAQTGERVRIRFGNVGQESHPIHLHGHQFRVVATDGGDIPLSAQWPETTVLVAPEQTRDIEFTATAGDWALHCHRQHHPMNAMGHDVPNLLGVSQEGVAPAIQFQFPDYMAMGEKGMEEMTRMEGMEGPANTLPMMGGEGPFGAVGMGGMFTLIPAPWTRRSASKSRESVRCAA